MSDDAVVGIGGIFFVTYGILSIAFRSSIAPWLEAQTKESRFGSLYDWTRFTVFWGVLAILFGIGAFLAWMLSL